MKTNFNDCTLSVGNMKLGLTAVVLSFTSFCFSSSAHELMSKQSRKIASVEEEVLTVPVTKSTFSKEVIFQEDDSGVMKGMKEDLYEWEKRREFAELWDLEGIQFYEAPTANDQKKYLGKKVLRYLDRRLNGEMKKAQEGSTLHSIRTVEKSLRPDATVAMTKNFSVKFKFRALQGKLITDFRNPWVESNLTLGANGKVKFITKKHFKELGLTGGTELSVTESTLLAYIDQEFTQNIKGRVSTYQENGMNIFGNDADTRVEIVASFPFNM